jgi:DNA modification methylase
VAARILCRDFVGFELSEEYWKIATERVKHYLAQRKLSETVEEHVEPTEKPEDDWGSLKDWGNIKPETEVQA